MSIYKRGKSYWYEFEFKGQRIQKSTRQSNYKAAVAMESAHKTAMAKGDMGILERKRPPTLREFAQRFMDYISVRCAAKARTVLFYAFKMKRLLEYEPLAQARLDGIDEALIEQYVQHRRQQVSPATVNRHLATLRRALRLAQEWRLIDRVPRIRLLPGERVREFVLRPEQERLYLGAAPEPLQDAAVLILDTGLRVGEATSLEWPDLRLEPVNGAKYGYLHVRDGKSKNARRNICLTARVRAMLERRKQGTSSPWVFPGKEAGQPFQTTSLNHQHQKVRAALNRLAQERGLPPFPEDFVIHSLRHTMLTRLGEAGADAFTIMRIAGHSSVVVSQRYIHPTPEAIERAFERLEIMLNGREPAGLPEPQNGLPVPTNSPTLAEAMSVTH